MPKKNNTYTSAEISGICKEINEQWDNHLTCRAVFFSGMDLSVSCHGSPSYYVNKGIDIKFQLPTPLTPILRRTLHDAPNWQNQNYIIRLCGILDEAGLMTAGKEQENPYTKILGDLRSKVGAHSSGKHSTRKKKSKDIQDRIQKYLDPKFKPEHLDSFNLSIDAVLERIKNRCIEFAISMIDREKPVRSQEGRKCCKGSA